MFDAGRAVGQGPKIGSGEPIGRVPPSPEPASTTKPPTISGDSLHVVFFSDAHARMPLITKLVDDVNRRQPDLVIDGGDRVHDATAAEFQRTGKALDGIKAPMVAIEGNHELELRGPFETPQTKPPAFQSFDQQGVHFILLDNSDETLTEEQFQQLEQDLEANRGKTTIVAMHVPPVLSKESLTTKLGKVLPMDFASPVMTQPDQIERFMNLMSQYQVSAVLSGHTHKPDLVVRDGVQYVVAGSVGGQTPGLGVGHEYLDIKVADGQVAIERVPLDKPTRNPVTYGYEFFRYFSDLNSANHADIGWSYTPGVSVQLKAGSRISQTSHGASIAGSATAAFENLKPQGGRGGIVGELTAVAGPREFSTELVGAYKYRVLGEFNRNGYVTGGVGLNGGVVAKHLTGGVGARVGLGAEYKALTFEVGHEVATNRRMSFATVGFRF